MASIRCSSSRVFGTSSPFNKTTPPRSAERGGLYDGCTQAGRGGLPAGGWISKLQGVLVLGYNASRTGIVPHTEYARGVTMRSKLPSLFLAFAAAVSLAACSGGKIFINDTATT